MVLLTARAQALAAISLLALPIALLTLRVEVVLFTLLVLTAIPLDIVFFTRQARNTKISAWREKLPERAIVDSILTTRVNVRIEGYKGVVYLADILPEEFKIVDGRVHRVSRTSGNDTISLEYTFKTIVRGDYRIGPITVVLLSPLGLVGERINGLENTVAYIKVVPQFYALRYKGRQAVARHVMPPGGHSIRMRGLGVDLEYVRDYRPGDDFRRIAWKISAKNPRRELMVKETSGEVRLSLFIVLDAGIESSLGYPRRLIDYYVEAAGSLILAALDFGDIVGLYVSGTPSLLVPLTRRREYLYMALKFLETLNPSHTRSLLHRVPEVLASVLPRRSIVFYFSSLENVMDVGGIVDKTRALGHKPVFMLPYTPSFIEIPRDRASLKPFYGKILGMETRRIEDLLKELSIHGAKVVVLKPVDFVSKTLYTYYSLREYG